MTRYLHNPIRLSPPPTPPLSSAWPEMLRGLFFSTRFLPCLSSERFSPAMPGKPDFHRLVTSSIFAQRRELAAFSLPRRESDHF